MIKKHYFSCEEGRKSLKVQCPAKINLSLKVLDKRDDGFHNIKSIMQTISLYDFLTISIVKKQKCEIKISGTTDEIPYNEKNLVHKATTLFIQKTGISTHLINIHIEKNIPISAGLAGGSTDAAGTLYGLNELFENPLSKKEIHELCTKLGSDLNFCLEGGKQMTTGRGEVLQSLEFEEFSVSLIKPLDLGISAKEAYAKLALKRQNGLNSDEKYKNDLEWAIFDDYKQLQMIKKEYPNAIMSGSGSTYFGINMEFKQHENCFVKNNLKSIPNGILIL